MEYKLNYKFQERDDRDFKYPLNIDKDINTTRIFSLDIAKIQIYDQGSLGSCVSNAIAGAIQYYNYTINPSRLYIYFNARALLKDINTDSGLSIRQGCNSVLQYHTTNENDWIYDVSNFTTMPPLYCYKNSFNYKNFIYYNVSQDLQLLKTGLLAGNPILFAFMVYTSFMSDEVKETGRVPMPDFNIENIVGENIEHRVVGGHCSIIIGFNDQEQVFKCVNSWGANWGDSGVFYMPYQYILNPLLCSDFVILNFNSTTPIITTPITTPTLIIPVKRNYYYYY
jgi:C1A family cysteine protease